MSRRSKPEDSRKSDFEILDHARLQVRDLPSPSPGNTDPEPFADEFDLKTILDKQRIQTIMDDFHSLTGMVTAILDLEGNVLESTGWQDLCTRFHRQHPVTSRNCTESDLALAAGLQPGQYADYHCKNGLRDVVTPLFIRNRHVGNIFTGQFFYDDDEVVEEEFIRRARQHGFDEDEYLAALRRIPRYSRETIAHLMSFLVRMTEHISQIGLKNLELAREIHIRQQAELGWFDSRSKLQAVIRAIPDLVWMKDPDGVYLLCNQRFEQFFGAASSEILGKTDADFLTPEQTEFFRGHDRRAMERGQPTLNIEEVEFASDGHRETLETIKTPLHDEMGRISGVLGIGRDITERLQAEHALRENEARLRDAQRMESIGRLAAGVAHDLNNLLTPIMGYTQIIAEGLAADNTHQESLERIGYATGRARDLVAQLLAFGRRQTMKYRTVDLNEAARNVEKLLVRSLGPNIHLRLALGESLPPVKADQSQIEQVLMNLALNGADAMPQGGQLLIESRVVPTLDAEVESGATGPFVMLAVRDTGQGLDPETQARIFEPFFSTKGNLGMGLGLATVHGIVKQHGGEITVDSEVGRGSSFCVYLPVVTGEVEGEGLPAGEPGECQPEERAEEIAAATILLVEDNEDVRSIAVQVLERKGYDVLQADSGEAALELLDAENPRLDLLVTDMLMPGLSGKDLHERVVGRFPGLPVLFISGFTDLELPLDDEGDRGGHFLAKPFLPADLLSQVKSLLE